MCDIVDLNTLPHVPYLPPSTLLPPHRWCPTRHCPCVVATFNTHNPPVVRDETTGDTVNMTIQEMERMQGWPTNISRLGGTQTTAARLQHVGNALNGRLPPRD